MNAERVLAFDYGTKKTGVAYGVLTGHVVSPKPLLLMENGQPDWPTCIEEVRSLNPDLILVGYPLNIDSSESMLAKRAAKFARRLSHKLKEAKLNLPVALVDERLSSHEARHRLGRSQYVDSEAAALLIESFFQQPDCVLLLD